MVRERVLREGCVRERKRARVETVHREMRSRECPNRAREAFDQRVVSPCCSTSCSAPWIVWQGWKFIEPGLYRQEKRFVRFLVPGSALLTLAGLAFLGLFWSGPRLDVRGRVGTQRVAGTTGAGSHTSSADADRRSVYLY